MKALKLTGVDGVLCLVNFDKFETIVRRGNYTRINFNRGYTEVLETPEEIYDKLYPNILG